MNKKTTTYNSAEEQVYIKTEENSSSFFLFWKLLVVLPCQVQLIVSAHKGPERDSQMTVADVGADHR